MRVVTLSLAGLICRVAALSTSPDVQTSVVSDCNILYLVKATDSCSSIASQNGISLATFYTWNPAVGSSCNMLFPDYYVCVGITGGTTFTTSPVSTTSTISTTSTVSTTSPISTSRTVSTTSPISTTSGNSTPSAIPTNVGSSCNAFYIIRSGDTCSVIAAANHIDLTQFYAWNPTVDKSCTNLHIGDSVSAPANPPIIFILHLLSLFLLST